jgi:5-carboxymethyl-2-hydroxymuconate isomerase
MPHFTIEYSSNLDGEVDMNAVCRAVREAALSTGIFEEGGIRVRAVRCDAFAVADDHPENAFAHMVLRLGRGRDLHARKVAGEAIFAAFEAQFAPRLESPHFGISFEMCEIDPGLSWKTNTIHPRLRGI